ncbi:MAG: tetratricopeptide repeat protein [Trueperaceae bacterium]
MRRRSHRFPVLRTLALLAIAWSAATAQGQAFSSDRYLEQCLRFEAGGDLGTARGSCLNALEIEPDLVDAQLALARIEFGLGELASAESRLQQIRGRVPGAEPAVLLAEIAFASERVDEAAAQTATARSLLAQQDDLGFRARVAYLDGRIAETRGEIDAALAAYAEAVAADGLEVRYRLASAELQYRLGDFDGTLAELRAYEALSGGALDADVKSLIGRALWAQGDATEAAGQIETALALRTLRDSSAQAADLRALSVLYFGQGDVEGGGLALREASRRGNLIEQFDGNTMLWLLVLAVLLAVHLVGETRHGGMVTAAAEGPKPWSLGQAYGILLTSVLVGSSASIVYGVLVHENLLVLLTPYQQHEARSVYLIVFAVTIAGLSWWRVRRNGWDAGERLLGRSDGVLSGVLVGALLYGGFLAYLLYVPRGGAAGPLFLDLASLTPLRVAALAAIPLAEPFFRGVLRPAASHRYGGPLTVTVVGLAWALTFATPLLALVPAGLALAEIDRRRPNGLAAATALWVAWLGIAATVAVSPFVRSLFL